MCCATNPTLSHPPHHTLRWFVVARSQVEELYGRLAKFRKGLAKKMLAGFEDVPSLALLKIAK